VNPADDLRLFPDNSFDLVYSNIVLQHMEPRYSESYIGEFIRVLKPGGMTYFQLPAEPDEAGTAECPAVPLSAFAGKLSWVSFPSSLRAGQPSNVRVRVQNTGALAWPGRGKMRVKAGNHWRAADGAVIAWDDGRKDLPGDLPKGAECVVDVRVVPPAAGRLILEMDLVQEHVAWFSSQGCETLRRGFLVKPAAPAAAPRAEFEPTMELYGVPVDRVKHLLDAAGATLLDAQEDGWAGPDWLSYHYVAIKR
jgi:SAM-dependent methyltransferase